jgi:transcriptional regulator with XRE-family HTH domain
MSQNLIGQRLKKIRKDNKLTQKTIADQLGVAPSHYSRLERDVAKPSDTLLKLIANLFNINQEWLYNGNGSMFNDQTDKTSQSFNWDVHHKLDDIIDEFINQYDIGLEKNIRRNLHQLLYTFYHDRIESYSDTQIIDQVYSFYSMLSGTQNNQSTDKGNIQNANKIINKSQHANTVKGNMQQAETINNTVNNSRINKHSQDINTGTYVDRSVNNTQKIIKKIITPLSTDQIGGNPDLKRRITELFNKIGDSRKQRFGQKAYPVMYNKFKKDFGIKNNPWTIIWTWPKNTADDIIEYLDAKYANTIDGRLNYAAQNKEYNHTRGHLYRKEKEAIDQLKLYGVELSKEDIQEIMSDRFGVTSHRHLKHDDHFLLVKHLEQLVEEHRLRLS